MGLGVNWQKTKIQSTVAQPNLATSALVSGNPVDVVDSFTYPGSDIHSSGSSESEVRRRITLAKCCSNQLNRGIWRSSISLNTKIQLYPVCIQPILLYGSETWAITKTLQDMIDAFDNYCLRCILRISYRDNITNATVRRRSGFPTKLSQLVQTRRLHFFGHAVRMDPSLDINRAIRVSVRGLPRDWKHPPGRPRHTWLRSVEADLLPLNLGLDAAWQLAQNRTRWRHFRETATLQSGVCS